MSNTNYLVFHSDQAEEIASWFKELGFNVHLWISDLLQSKKGSCVICFFVNELKTCTMFAMGKEKRKKKKNLKIPKVSREDFIALIVEISLTGDSGYIGENS